MTVASWWTEFRRGVGLIGLAGMGVLGATLLLTQAHWAGSLTSLAALQRFMLLVMGPLILSLSIWDAGRDGRRGMTEMLHTACHPLWRRTLLRVSTLAAAVIAAHLLVAGLGAAFVTQQTTYLGGRWWLVLLFATAGYLPVRRGRLVDRIAPALAGRGAAGRCRRIPRASCPDLPAFELGEPHPSWA